MSRFKQLIERAASAEPHHGITLMTGEYREGYILEFGEDWLEFGEGGPCADAGTTLYRQAELRCVWYSTDAGYVCFTLEDA